VKEILFEASGLAGERRRTFLDFSCAGDAALRAEVESLLAYHRDHEIAAGAADENSGEGGAPEGSRSQPSRGRGKRVRPRGGDTTRKP
jgi:hypothetical protein